MYCPTLVVIVPLVTEAVFTVIAVAPPAVGVSRERGEREKKERRQIRQMSGFRSSLALSARATNTDQQLQSRRIGSLPVSQTAG